MAVVVHSLRVCSVNFRIERPNLVHVAWLGSGCKLAVVVQPVFVSHPTLVRSYTLASRR